MWFQSKTESTFDPKISTLTFFIAMWFSRFCLIHISHKWHHTFASLSCTVYASSIRTGIYLVFLYWINHRITECGAQKNLPKTVRKFNKCGLFLCVVAVAVVVAVTIFTNIYFLSHFESPLVIVTILTGLKHKLSFHYAYSEWYYVYVCFIMSNRTSIHLVRWAKLIRSAVDLQILMTESPHQLMVSIH